MSSLLTDETYGVLMGELAHTDKVNPMWMHGNNLNSYVAWFVGTVVGTALGGLLPNPEIFGLDFCPGWDVHWNFCFAIPDYAKTDSCPQSAHYPSSCCGVLLLLLTVVSQSLAVLFCDPC